MNQRQAYKLARETMDEHGLKDWSFGFDQATRRLGVCFPRRKRIQLSTTFTKLNDLDKVYQVILHEVAHALCPPYERHGSIWQAKALEIGCREAKSTTTSVTAPARYVTKCPNGHLGSSNRRPRRGNRSCGRCSRTYNPLYAITYLPNPEYAQALGRR